MRLVGSVVKDVSDLKNILKMPLVEKYLKSAGSRKVVVEDSHGMDP